MKTRAIEKEKPPYGVAQDRDHLPPLVVTQKWLDEAHREVFGPDDETHFVPVTAYRDSTWARLLEQFYRERIVQFATRMLSCCGSPATTTRSIWIESQVRAALLNCVMHLCGKV